jgi:shikimate kinase
MKKSDPDQISPENSAMPRLTQPLVLIGMMGAGKSSVGRAVAKILSVPFFDADIEIEAAAGRSVAQIFADYGEAEFRRLERLVIGRLLDGGVCILSLGGGAFIDDTTRARIKSGACSVWLKVEPDLLIERVTRHGDRPMLSGDPRGKMTQLLADREPVYAQANLTILCDDRPVTQTAQRVVAGINEILK